MLLQTECSSFHHKDCSLTHRINELLYNRYLMSLHLVPKWIIDGFQKKYIEYRRFCARLKKGKGLCSSMSLVTFDDTDQCYNECSDFDDIQK